MQQPQPQSASGGLAMALGAHLVWGLLPLYLKLVHAVPPVEFVGWRIVFALPFCLLFILLRRQLGELWAILRSLKTMRALAASALLIAANWLIYVFAIQTGHVYAASFGYYVSPLMQVLAGTLFLGERLSPRQWWAVALAGLGVAVLGWGELSMLWISLALAASWSGYGLIRKLVPVGSLPGLTVEAMVLIPFAAGYLAWLGAGPTRLSFGHELGMSSLIVLAGPLTALPLTLFAIAARRLKFSTLGMLQFTSPTVVFLLGATVFGLPLEVGQLASFAIIWAAIAMFLWDLVAPRRLAEKTPA
ncbi:MAG TPA: EamA family transporter RarD [Novosphingobium sp.]|nr:EamA family transporter RarD [Novosphingobium sp.]